MLAALLLAANLEVAKAPVTIDECAMVVSGSHERGVHVRFHNNSPHSIQRVTFHVHNGNHAIDVVDHGTFTTGTEIDHVLTTPAWELYHGGVSDCAVKSVTFAKGNVWNAPPHP